MKEIKTLDEQVEILQRNKNVVFNKINIPFAKNILLKYNYINVITPYKKNFYSSKSSCGKHVYNSKTEFEEYYNLYSIEKEENKKLLDKILEFEKVFSSITSYYVFMNLKRNYNSNIYDYIKFISSKDDVEPSKKDRYDYYCNSIKAKMRKYEDGFILFDRLTFGEMIFMFDVSEENVKKRVLDKMIQFNLSAGVKESHQFGKFKSKAIILKDIRNVLCHNNNFEIFKDYVFDKKLSKYRKRKFYTDHPYSIKDIEDLINSI